VRAPVRGCAMAPQPDKDVEIDMERKQELIMAKKLRACRVNILPKRDTGFVPEVFEPKRLPSKEPLHISMKQASRKPGHGAPSPAAMAAANNPIALRYWNQCLALSSQPSSVDTPAEAPCLGDSFPPWASPPSPPSPTSPEECSPPRKISQAPKVPDMRRKISEGRSGGRTDWASVLAEEDAGKKFPTTRFPKPWAQQNKKQGSLNKYVDEKKEERAVRIKEIKGLSEINSNSGLNCQARKPEATNGVSKDKLCISPVVHSPTKHSGSNTFSGQNVTTTKKAESVDTVKSPSKNVESSKETNLLYTENISQTINGSHVTNGISEGVCQTSKLSNSKEDTKGENKTFNTPCSEVPKNAIKELFQSVPVGDKTDIINLLLCTLPTDSLLEVVSTLLSKETLGEIILQSMSKESRGELIVKIVKDDPALKARILKGDKLESEMRNTEESKVEQFVEENGDCTDATEIETSKEHIKEDSLASVEIVISSESSSIDSEDINIRGKTDIPDDTISNSSGDLSVSSLDNTADSKEEIKKKVTVEETSETDNMNVLDCLKVGSGPQDVEDSIYSSTMVSEEKARPIEISDTDVYEDEDDDWEYEWEEGEENEFEYMEQDEDEYAVESFAGSFNISVASK